MNNKIAILGGTFDPVHNGHIAVAKKVIELGIFKELLFIPNKVPPLKNMAIATAQQRLAMVELAVDQLKAQLKAELKNNSNNSDNSDNLNNINNCNITICEYELDNTTNKQSYTIDTINYLIKKYLNNKIISDSKSLYLILGLDAYLNISNWHKSEQLKELCSFLVINRCTDLDIKNYKLTDTKTEYVYYLDIKPIDISSTQIREVIKAVINENNKNKQNSNSSNIIDLLKSELSKLIPSSVAEYIINNKIYFD